MMRNLVARLRARLAPDRSTVSHSPGVSAGYERLVHGDDFTLDGWKDRDVVHRQHEAFAPLVQEAHSGRPRLDFEVAARAIAATGMENPLIVEIGCASGYYSEVLPALLGAAVRYVGLDYSPAMVAHGGANYPASRFIAGDARSLPLRDASCDIVLSGTSLMHIAEYSQAIAESARVARSWCVFHTVPVLERQATVLLRKHAYGGPVLEVIFNRGELETRFWEAGLIIRECYESIPYDVSAVVGEPSRTLTYVCEKS